jgi:hypothetical protein
MRSLDNEFESEWHRVRRISGQWDAMLQINASDGTWDSVAYQRFGELYGEVIKKAISGG